jgi:HlyD family secretion protein
MPRNKTVQSIRRHVIAVAIASALLIGSVGMMGAATELAGAVISSGSIVVESSVKKVQHPTGGVVKELRVADGQRVASGELLVRLDETVANANLAAVTKSYWELQARRARLEAERENHTTIAFPDELLNSSEPSVAATISGEENQFRIRRDAAENHRRQLRERISQLSDEIEGLKEQLSAKKQEHQLIQKELAGVETLWDQKLVSITRLTALQREAARLLGDRGQLASSIAQSKGKISEIELQILQIDEDNRRDIAKELAEVRSKFEETAERRIAAEDVASRVEIRSPQDGIVHDLSIHTKGGVVTAGETLMLIVPDHDNLIVETRIAPRDIDQVEIGQTAVVRFPNFNQRTTPEISGKIARVGADVSRENKSSSSYFVVRVAIAQREADRLGAAKLVPGMPAEVFIRTSNRTILSYLMKPLVDQVRRAFREK